MKFIYILLFLLTLACNKQKNTASPTYRSLVEAVYASGNVYPANEYKLIANADGYLQKQFASEGDVITKNQVLFQIESTMQDARSEAASNIYRQTEDNYSNNSVALKELEAQINITKNKLGNDSLNYARYKNLQEQNIGTKIDYERAKLMYETSQQEYKARKNALQRLKNQLFIDLQNAKSNYKINAREEQNYQVRSFEAGKIYEVYKKVGEFVRRGEVLALLGDSKESVLQLAVDESDFAKIELGQEILLKIDVYGDKVFKGIVKKVYPKLNKIDQTFRVDAAFLGEKPNAYYGLSVEANIIISQKEKALTIPKTLLLGQDSVWIEDAGEKKKIKIQKGIETLDFVEIKGGLTDKSILLTERQ